MPTAKMSGTHHFGPNCPRKVRNWSLRESYGPFQFPFNCVIFVVREIEHRLRVLAAVEGGGSFIEKKSLTTGIGSE